MLLHSLPIPKEKSLAAPIRFLSLGLEPVVVIPESGTSLLLERGEVLVQIYLLLAERPRVLQEGAGVRCDHSTQGAAANDEQRGELHKAARVTTFEPLPEQDEEYGECKSARGGDVHDVNLRSRRGRRIESL